MRYSLLKGAVAYSEFILVCVYFIDIFLVLSYFCLDRLNGKFHFIDSQDSFASCFPPVCLYPIFVYNAFCITSARLAQMLQKQTKTIFISEAEYVIAIINYRVSASRAFASRGSDALVTCACVIFL